MFTERKKQCYLYVVGMIFFPISYCIYGTKMTLAFSLSLAKSAFGNLSFFFPLAAHKSLYKWESNRDLAASALAKFYCYSWRCSEVIWNVNLTIICCNEFSLSSLKYGESVSQHFFFPEKNHLLVELLSYMKFLTAGHL